MRTPTRWPPTRSGPPARWRCSHGRGQPWPSVRAFNRVFPSSSHEPVFAPAALFFLGSELHRWAAHHGVHSAAGGAAGAVGALRRWPHHLDRGRVPERDRHARPGRPPPQRHAGRPGGGGYHGVAHQRGRPQRVGAGPGNRGAGLWADDAAGVGGAGRGRGHRRPAERGAAAGPPAHPGRRRCPTRACCCWAASGTWGWRCWPTRCGPTARPSRRLGECIHALARFLALKARFYEAAHRPRRRLPPAGGPAGGGEREAGSRPRPSSSAPARL